MTKTAFAIAAALLAGTTLTSAANAGGIRVGFGFPLGSFVAHSNQSYAGDGYGRRCDHERRAARRHYEAVAAPVRHVKPKAEVAETKTDVKTDAKPVTTAKLDDRLSADPETTTDVVKTDTDADTTTATKAEPAPATTASTDTAKTEKVATVEKPAQEGDLKVIKVPTSEGKQVCRRYSAAIAALVDVPCDGK
jgi:hypothetical protein